MAMCFSERVHPRRAWPDSGRKWETCWCRGLLPGLSGRQSLRLSARKSVSEASPQSAFARHCQVLGPNCVRETWCTASFRGQTFRELMVKSVGKPDARKGHVRFDERGRETGGCQTAPHRALPRLYVRPKGADHQWREDPPM